MADAIFDAERIAAVRAAEQLDTDEEAFDRLTRIAAAALHAPFAFVTLADDRRSYFKSVFPVDCDTPGPREIPVEDSFCQYVVRSSEPLIVGDVRENPLTRDNPAIDTMGVAAWAGFPLVGPTGHMLGSFCVVDTVVRDWTPAEIELLGALANAAAGELAMRDAVARAEVTAERLTLLAEVGAVLAESPQPAGAMTRLVKLIVPKLGDFAIVSLSEAGGPMVDVAWWHADPARAADLDEYVRYRSTTMNPRSATARAQASSEPVMIESGILEVALAVLDSDRAKAALRRLAPESGAVYPLVARRQRVGVLAIARNADRPPAGPIAREVSAAIAQRAALAVDNGRLYDEQVDFATRLRAANDRLRRVAAKDRDVSVALQEAILPRLAPVTGLDVAARYETASESERVGGDWYDTIALPDGSTLLVVGDVSGHSMAAAGIMGQLHSMLRAFAWDRGETPAALLTRLDRAVRELGEPWLATVVVVHVGVAAAGVRTLRWSTAGHPPPLLVGPDGVGGYLIGNADPPVGVVTALQRREYAVDAVSGSVVLLYTDGLIDTRGTDIEGRQDELLTLLRDNSDAAPEAVLDAVLAGMHREAGEDDVVLLTARLA